MISSLHKRKYLLIIIFVLIIILGWFLRSYHFNDTVFFEIDQARDYRIVYTILHEGLDEFPLVGPKAGGTFFRLGALSYLPPLLSAKLFGLSIPIMALHELLFSILTLPLLYVFLREYFCARIALYLTSLFSVSLFAVVFAHFSWNPNSIPFFLMLVFYGILRYSRADGKERLLWAVITAFATAIVMQLHTIALIGTPLIIVLYFLLAKIKIALKEAVLFCAIIVALFLPLIINDLLTKGENTDEFFKATIVRSATEERTTMPKQVFMNVYNFTQFYATLLTSHQVISKPIRIESSYTLKDLIVKNISDNVLRNNMLRASIIFLIFLLFFSLLGYKYYQTHRSNTFSLSKRKRNFIILIVLWQGVYFVISHPLALDVDSRYFLSVVFIPLIFLGLAIKLIEDFFQKYGKAVTFICMMSLIMFSLSSTLQWLHSIDHYREHSAPLFSDFILEPYFLITSRQWREISDHIEKRYDKDHFSKVYIHATPYHTRSLRYLLALERSLLVENINIKKERFDPGGLYYLLRETDKVDKGRPLPSGYGEKFSIEDQIDFGTVQLLRLAPRDVHEDFVQSFSNEVINVTSPNRCYMLDRDIEERSKCFVKDIPYLWSK